MTNYRMAQHEIAQLRQTVAMLQPGSNASVRREDILRLVAEVQRLQNDLNGLTSGLRTLLDRSAST
ncbi:MAG: hypothetical protein R2770_18545 [Acidimicrobiales bacterium]|nr:hypothetical protein [Acidimicrobiales bacterium]